MVHFRIEMSGGTSEVEEEEFAIVQYMKFTEQKDEVNNCQGFVCLRCGTTDEIDHCLRPKRDNIELVGENVFGLEPISSLEGRISMTRSNYANSQFSVPLHRAKQRFYINRFYGSVREVMTDVSSIIKTWDIPMV